MSRFPSLTAFVAFSVFLGLLLVVLVYHLALTVAKPQEGRTKKRRRRGNKGDARDFVLLETSQPSRTRSPIDPEMDGEYKIIVHQFNRTLQDLTRYLDTLNCETSEGSDSSWTSITASEVGSSSSVSLSSSREDLQSFVTASEASSSAEVYLSPLRDDSWTTITASDGSCSSRASQPTLVDGADMADASSVQPGLGHPSAGPEEQPAAQGDVHSPSPSGLAQRAPLQSEGAPQGQADQVSERPSASYGDKGPPELPLEKSVPMGEADRSLEGQSSSSEDLGIPELPSDLTAPPRSSSPQTQHSSSEETPSALPLPPDSVDTGIQIPHLEELLTALPDCYRASQADEDLQKELDSAGCQMTDPAAELLSALQSSIQRAVQKSKESAQDRAGSRGLCPNCTKALHHSLPGSDGSQTWTPSDAAAPCSGREGTVGERRPPEDKAKRQQGQTRAAVHQQTQRVHVCGSTIRIPLFRHRWLLPQCSPTTLVPP